jgi:superoxide reductase
MKNRRKFLKNSLIAAGAVTLAGPLMAAVPGKKEGNTNRFPGILYTEKDQGRWQGKAPSHVPQVKTEGNKVTLHTVHPMTEEHYIVRHTLVDASGKVLGSKTFYPTDVQPISTFELPAGFHGKLYATSFCNKHDFWVKEFTV